MFLGDVAEKAMDLYYQDYKAESDFIDETHFAFMVVAAYNKLISDEFTQSKLINKQMSGFSMVELSEDWTKTERLKVEEDDGERIVKLPGNVITFPFDALGSGVQGLKLIGGSCKEVVRISHDDTWQIELIETTQTFFYVRRDRGVFINLKCFPTDVKVTWVPEISADDMESFIPEAKVLPIITTVLEMMFAAKNGKVVDKTANDNQNAVMQSEIDKNTMQ